MVGGITLYRTFALYEEKKEFNVLRGRVPDFASGNIVTYMVQSGESYQEKVGENKDILNPTTFTPTISGWTFVGWREDTTANGSVLSSKVMGKEPINLYAVFKQDITVSYTGNGNTGGSTASQTGTRYYNNGKVTNPSITLRANGFTKTNYGFAGWKNGSTEYKAGTSYTFSSSIAMAAQWYTTAVTNFSYTGTIQSYTVPVSGLYMIEAYGGAGESTNGVAGGKGGYSKGYAVFSKDQVLTIKIGVNDGHGSAKTRKYGSGDHIGTQYLGRGGYGVLILRNSTLLLAGGGGGGAAYGIETTGPDGRFSDIGGAGGGTTGGNGKAQGYAKSASTGGTQSTNGNAVVTQYGGNTGGAAEALGGGGGGYHSGGSGGLWSDRVYAICSGAGGSGYIGGVPAINYGGKTYSPSITSGINSDNGKASIQFITS